MGPKERRSTVLSAMALLTDNGYDGDRFRENLLLHGILPIIPPRSNSKVLKHLECLGYGDRNRFERLFNKLKQSRRTATRYDKTALSLASFLNLTVRLKSFVGRA